MCKYANGKTNVKMCKFENVKMKYSSRECFA
jgi:hypothetical protein